MKKTIFLENIKKTSAKLADFIIGPVVLMFATRQGGRLLAISLISLFFAFGGGCQSSQQKNVVTAPAPKTQASVAGINLDMLEMANLHLEWVVSNLPMNKNVRIKRMFYHNGNLYLLDGSNTLFQLNVKEGTIQWLTHLPESYISESPAFFYDGRILFTSAGRIIEIAETDGKQLKMMMPQFMLSSNAAGDGKMIFVGGVDKRIYCLNADDGIPIWYSLQPAEPTGTIALDDKNVYFVCEDGVLYVSRKEKRLLLWKMATEGQSVGVVVNAGQCFLPDTDTGLYCIDAASGKLQWKYLSGQSLTSLPVLTDKYVYQVVDSSALDCLDRYTKNKAGHLRWRLPDGCCFLAENGPLSYAITYNHELTVMHNQDGKKVLSFYVPNMDIYATNTEDSTIFLASSKGTVVAIKPNSSSKTGASN